MFQFHRKRVFRAFLGEGCCNFHVFRNSFLFVFAKNSRQFCVKGRSTVDSRGWRLHKRIRLKEMKRRWKRISSRALEWLVFLSGVVGTMDRFVCQKLLVCRRCGTAAPPILRYISILGQWVDLLWSLTLRAQAMLTICPPCAKRFAQTDYFASVFFFVWKHCKCCKRRAN